MDASIRAALDNIDAMSERRRKAVVTFLDDLARDVATAAKPTHNAADDETAAAAVLGKQPAILAACALQDGDRNAEFGGVVATWTALPEDAKRVITGRIRRIASSVGRRARAVRAPEGLNLAQLLQLRHQLIVASATSPPPIRRAGPTDTPEPIN